jgi:hypothetical protein
MKIAKRSVTVRSPLIRVWLVAGAVVLCGPVASRAINSVTPSAGAAGQDAAAAQTAAWPRYSPGIADIAKMVDAKVDAEVIKTYVRNSPTAYNPSATEIIALKDRGVGPEILTAMLQRGAEVRVQSMQAAQAAWGAATQQANPGAANPYAPAPDYGYATQPVYPNDAYSYPVDSYAYPGYNYGYGNYGYGWPYFWPSLSFSFGGYPYHGYGGYRYPYGYGGRGYGRYYGGGGYSGHGGRSVPFAGHSGGFHSFASGGRSAAFTGAAGGSRSAGGFSGHSASFASHGGGFSGHAASFGSRGVGSGGHASGRGR